MNNIAKAKSIEKLLHNSGWKATGKNKEILDLGAGDITNSQLILKNYSEFNTATYVDTYKADLYKKYGELSIKLNRDKLIKYLKGNYDVKKQLFKICTIEDFTKNNNKKYDLIYFINVLHFITPKASAFKCLTNSLKMVSHGGTVYFEASNPNNEDYLNSPDTVVFTIEEVEPYFNGFKINFKQNQEETIVIIATKE